MKLTTTLICMTLLAATAPAWADTTPAPSPSPDPKNIVDEKQIVAPQTQSPNSILSGWYLDAYAGGQERERAVESSVTWTSLDPGFIVGGGVGYRLNNNWRFELEGNYQYNQDSYLSAAGIGSHQGKGHIDLRSGFGDVFYDFHIGKSRWVPFVGGGIGLVNSRLNGLWFKSGTVPGTPAQLAGLDNLYGDAWAFAWNVQAGVTYEIDRHFDIYAEYRYQDSDRLDFHFNGNATVPTAGPNGAYTNSGEIGVRYHF